MFFDGIVVDLFGVGGGVVVVDVFLELGVLVFLFVFILLSFVFCEGGDVGVFVVSMMIDDLVVVVICDFVVVLVWQGWGLFGWLLLMLIG